MLSLLVSFGALAVAACTHNLYQFPLYTFAGRPIPPSQLAERVLVGLSANGSAGGLEILDALRDIRNNLTNTKPQFIIAGYTGSYPSGIYNFPEQQRGYIYSSGSPYSLVIVSYSSESSLGGAGTLTGPAASIGISEDFSRIYVAQETAGQLVLVDNLNGGAEYQLNLPNVSGVFPSQDGSSALVTVRNSNSLYRVIHLNPNSVAPPGAADCEPTLLPVYCVVPVPGTFDRPNSVSYSLDGSTAYVLSCGAECGGGTNGGAGISFIPQGALNINLIPTSSTYPAVVTNTLPIPGGATVSLSDGSILYVAGQQLQPDGLFAGRLTLINLSTMTAGAPISISDGSHNKLIFGDDNTLWIGSQYCASGERAAQAAAGNVTQAANYNCLTRYVTGTAAILPTWTANTAFAAGQEVTDGVNTEVVQIGGTSSGSTPSWKTTVNGSTTDGSVTWINIGPTTRAQVIPAVTSAAPSILSVLYQNGDFNAIYYGSLTGICWVQNYHKMYTAYGGQVHAFNTADGSERNNSQITVQGTALDVAYMDALTNTAN